MTPEELEFCNSFIEKWKKTVSGAFAGAIIKAKFARMTRNQRVTELRGYVFGAEDLSDKKGRTEEMREYVFAEADKLVESFVGKKT